MNPEALIGERSIQRDPAQAVEAEQAETPLEPISVEQVASEPTVQEFSPTLQRSLESSKVYRTEEFTDLDSETNQEVIASLRSIRNARNENQ